MTPIETKVRTGAAVLDQKMPGWYYDVNPRTLKMTSTRDCVLGQLYGEYGRGLDILRIDNGGVELGFDGYSLGLLAGHPYRARRAWTREINNRREADYVARMAFRERLLTLV